MSHPSFDIWRWYCETNSSRRVLCVSCVVYLCEPVFFSIFHLHSSPLRSTLPLPSCLAQSSPYRPKPLQPSRSLPSRKALKNSSKVSPPRSLITGIKLNGSWPHKSHDDPADPKPVISFALYKSNKLNSRNRVGSGHVHDDGTGHVNFPSKYKQYRAITEMEYKPPSSGTSGQSSSSGKSNSGGSNLIWRTNEQTKYAEWWDGTKWVAGDWSVEY
ncbi:hypothetical protein EJ08DRAFT_408510 [Tothia fuscella]|uniref:Uncharacterized protein n=1 Tax=Tothia fuscella TaxID=1048955 RepID=A0A9P4NKI5_9PEZI|nr:hypothetical protein EJ08DRAFT_408510 [Tothia fuscella]